MQSVVSPAAHSLKIVSAWWCSALPSSVAASSTFVSSMTRSGRASRSAALITIDFRTRPPRVGRRPVSWSRRFPGNAGAVELRCDHRLIGFDYQCESMYTGAVFEWQHRTASLAGQAPYPAKWQEKTNGISA